MKILFIVVGSLLWITGGFLFYKGVHRLKKTKRKE